MTSTEYSIALSSTLRFFNLTHPIYDVLLAIADLQAKRGHATIPTVCLSLSCTYQNVIQHIFKNSGFFLIDAVTVPRSIRLSPEAIQLLAAVNKRVETTQTQGVGA